jgi:hypothetical protein
MKNHLCALVTLLSVLSYSPFAISTDKFSEIDVDVCKLNKLVPILFCQADLKGSVKNLLENGSTSLTQSTYRFCNNEREWVAALKVAEKDIPLVKSEADGFLPICLTDKKVRSLTSFDEKEQESGLCAVVLTYHFSGISDALDPKPALLLTSYIPIKLVGLTT